MLFKTQSAAVYGIDAYVVEVEVDVGSHAGLQRGGPARPCYYKAPIPAKVRQLGTHWLYCAQYS